MKIRVICQICGRNRTLDTEVPIGPEPRWDNYRLGHIFNPDEIYPYENYEVWVCANCHRDFIIGYYANYDEVRNEDLGAEYDSDGLIDKIKESLGFRLSTQL